MTKKLKRQRRTDQIHYQVCENKCAVCQDTKKLRLAQIQKGRRCRIRKHLAQGAIRQRLMDLGFVPNPEVEMVRCATLGDPWKCGSEIIL
jgi:ferrous iron transport protein A